MSRQRPYRVLLARAAQRNLAELRNPAQRAIREALRELADDPRPPDSIDMSGKAQGMRRLRIGEHRAVYIVSDERAEVLVLRIGHRSEVYRGLEGR